MSKSALLEEDSSWAQTFFTVTPQDDGFLREIEDTAIVSGNANAPLNLDTWNIVLRRSLANATRDFIDINELEKPELIATECQTYLQGVPRVDLPLVYRDEATQTLYMGKDEKAPFEKAFDDIITVMNEKPLPEWKKSENVQTTITFENAAPLDDIVEYLGRQTSGTEPNLEKSNPMISPAEIESSDAIHFLIERALWMSEPVPISNIETKEAEVETMIKYNHVLKILTIDHEAQTDLSCDPKFSNSMLLSGYNGTKNSSMERNNSDLEINDHGIKTKDSGRESLRLGQYYRENETKVFDRKTIEFEQTDPNNGVGDLRRQTVEASLKNIGDLITANSNTMTEDFRGETIRTSLKTEVEPPAENYQYPSRNIPVPLRHLSRNRREGRKTESILLTNDYSYVSRNREEAARDPDLKPACLSPEQFRETTSSDNISANSQAHYKMSSTSFHSEDSAQISINRKKRLPVGDEKALQSLKNTFCTRNRLEEPVVRKGLCRCLKKKEALTLPDELKTEH